ncbi:YhcN/YlaJ family sporulation lipoprotein [Paenibacillus sp. CC-CFT747]|nr:YhcN/YlaJ family sporulation lipoprotein [Paenibacillus sp. CC-CFT747]
MRPGDGNRGDGHQQAQNDAGSGPVDQKRKPRRGHLGQHPGEPGCAPRTGKEYVQGTRRGGGQVQAQSVNDPGSPSTAALQPQIAEAVAALDEVTGANALVIDGKGYIGIIVKYGYPDTVMDVPGQSANVGEVSGKLKAKVAEAARRIDPGLKEVFVSAHPDFIDRIDRFPAHTKSGKPLEGYIREFGTIVSRLFPAGSGLPSASVTP